MNESRNLSLVIGDAGHSSQIFVTGADHSLISDPKIRLCCQTYIIYIYVGSMCLNRDAFIMQDLDLEIDFEFL